MKRNRTVDRIVSDTYRNATRDAITAMYRAAVTDGPLDADFFRRFLDDCEVRWAERDRQRREAGLR